MLLRFFVIHEDGVLMESPFAVWRGGRIIAKIVARKLRLYTGGYSVKYNSLVLHSGGKYVQKLNFIFHLV